MAMEFATDPEDFLGRFYSQYAGAKPKHAQKTAKSLVKQGLLDPFTAAEDFAAKAAASGWDQRRTEKGVRQITRSKYGMEPTKRFKPFGDIAEGTYQDLLGREATPEEIEGIISGARASRVSSSDPGAFQSYLMDRIMTSQEGMGRIKTPEDLVYERQYGAMTRGPGGELQRGTYAFDPQKIANAARAMSGSSAFVPGMG